jgi:hypothetical protein
MAACSRTPDRPTAAINPTAPSAANGIPGGVNTAPPGSLLSAPVPASGKFDAVFPARNLSNDFFQRLIAKYRDGLRRAATPLFIDSEGLVVWIQEYYRYIANGCDNATSIQRVFAQIDGNPAGALCNPPPSTALVAFPPRDQALAFALLLSAKYQQMGRPQTASFVDLEGAIIWVQEYLRYYTNGCDHETAIANTLTQIDGNPPPPVCRKTTCSYQPSDHPRPSGAGGTFTVLMFRREGDCDWTATSQSSFIKLETTSGSFSGPLTFTVEPNNGQSRRGTILVEWEGGSTEVIVEQSGPNFQVLIQLFDFNKQNSETSECDIVKASVQCTFKAQSFLPEGIATYSWRADYNYGGAKSPSQVGSSDTFVVNESCGGSGSTVEGSLIEIVVTLTATDTKGNTATVVTGQQGHPQKFLRVRVCP